MAQQEYLDAVNGFAVTVPPGWTVHTNGEFVEGVAGAALALTCREELLLHILRLHFAGDEIQLATAISLDFSNSGALLLEQNPFLFSDGREGLMQTFRWDKYLIFSVITRDGLRTYQLIAFDNGDLHEQLGLGLAKTLDSFRILPTNLNKRVGEQ